jgi:hypothetical protein
LALGDSRRQNDLPSASHRGHLHLKNQWLNLSRRVCFCKHFQAMATAVAEVLAAVAFLRVALAFAKNASQLWYW